MKKISMMAMAVLLVTSVHAISLAEARGKTDVVIANPTEMTSVMKGLSAADQKAFLASVNVAMGKMPGSAEEKSARVLNVDRAALRGSVKGNVTALIAEIIATAPVETLTLLNEVFAKDVLNRSADPSRTYTDEQFVQIAKKVMETVNARVAGGDDAGVRAGFAALMMIRASNGSPTSLVGDLADMLGDSAGIAKSEWFPAALGADHNYDPMLSGTAAEKAPEFAVALLISGPQRQEMMLTALEGGDPAGFTDINDGFGDWSQVQTTDHGVYTLPRTQDPTKKWNPEYKRGEDVPQPYDGQNVGL